jgi:hypothetical protein
MNCCDWNPHNYEGYHCMECCEIFLEFRDRDRHFALKHPDKVQEFNALWYRYNGREARYVKRTK